MLEFSKSSQRPGDPLNASEDAVRHNKASLSVETAFAAEGLPTPPAGLAAMVADYVNRQTRDIPAGKLASMAPGSGNLGMAAAAGVNMAIGSLTPDQRSVLRAGGNPLNPADMAAIGAKLGLSAYAGMAKGEAGISGSGGGRYAALKDATGGKDNPAMAQYVATLGRMSGNDFANRLGFAGEQAKEFGQIMHGTSGGFRKSVEDYNKVLTDPAATPEQKAEARKNVQKNAKSKKDKDAVGKVFEKLDAKSNDENVEKSKVQGEAAKPTVADQKAVMEALRKKRAAAAPQ
jgi:hypothetical protein